MTFRRVASAIGAHAGLCAVVACIVVFCAIYIDLAFYRLHALLLGIDTGVYTQALRHFFETGSTDNFGEYRPKLSVHDSWTVFGLAPLVALFPHASTILIVGILALAVAAIPLYAFGRVVGLCDWQAAAIAIAYLVEPSAQGWAFGNFTEAHFIPLLAFSLAIALRRRSLLWVLILAELLTGIKEDQSLFLIWIALAVVALYDLRLAWTLALVGAANFFGYEAIQRAYGFEAHNPGYRLYDSRWPQHLAFLVEIAAPFAFAALYSGRRLVVALPFVAEITLNAPWPGTREPQQLAIGGWHYTIPLVTMMALGVVFVVAERRVFARAMVPAALVMALLFNPTVVHVGRHRLPADWAAYCAAERIAADRSTRAYYTTDEGFFAIAAANTNVRFVRGKPVDRIGWWSGRVAPRANSPQQGCDNVGGGTSTVFAESAFGERGTRIARSSARHRRDDARRRRHR